MAASFSCSGRAPRQTVCHKAKAMPALGHFAFKRTTHFEQHKMEILQNSIHLQKKAENKLFKHHKNKLFPVMTSMKSTSFSSSPLSASHTIKEFYTCINEKKLKQLGDYISADCYIEECSFSTPFQGKREVMRFFEQLAASMGQNVRFSLKHVCEGDELIAAANWHLEWKNEQIPFTRGCSVFECSKEGEKIIIKKAQIMIESPIKPGGLVLTLFKTVTSLFDDFPKATQWFLSKPHVMLQWVLKIYTMFLRPFINPLLEGYITMWKYTARLLGYAFYILIQISKFFIK